MKPSAAGSRFQSSGSRRATAKSPSMSFRLLIIGLGFVMVGLVFTGRLFYLQIIKGEEYRRLALTAQTKSLVIPPKRGEIFAYNGGQQVPLVLNERRWLVFADTKFIDSQNTAAEALRKAGIEITEAQKQQLATDSRYVVLGKYLTDDQRKQIHATNAKGLYFQEQSQRAYTEGSLAAQVLGFVGGEGQGQYGIEQQFEDKLTGEPGQLKAVTDARGVPLAFEEDNIAKTAVDGQDILLTLDVGLQEIAESAIRSGVERTESLSGSLVILDAADGAVRAMANFPSYNPAEFSQVSDISVFVNRAITDAVEPGSVMKPLVMAAALDTDVVGVDDTYHDPNEVELDGAVVQNALNYGAGRRKVQDILTNSLNTGSTYLLGLLGGGQVNLQARETYFSYLTEKFRLGKQTGISLPNESAGVVYSPSDGHGLNIRYANMTFGQGLTLTPLQLAATYGALITGQYYRPYIVDSIGQQQQTPELLVQNALSTTTVEEVRELMRRMGQANYPDVQIEGLEVSGKTGTAEIADAQGGYLEDEYTGMFAGYVKSADKTLIITLRLDRPQNVRFAGSGAAVPVWKDVVRGIVKTGRAN